jgi:hypothetical protein
MRLTAVLATIVGVGLVAAPAAAQSVEIAGSYSNLAFLGGGSNFLPGWLVSVAGAVTPSIAAIGEVGCTYGTDSPRFSA